MPECSKKKNLGRCTCTYSGCSRQGVCCECLQYHWANRELPGCLFPPEAEKTYDRSLEHFIPRLVQAGMNILIAPDSFKESLSSIEAARRMQKACRRAFPSATTVLFPLADGGEGTIDVLHAILGGSFQSGRVLDPLVRPIRARWLKRGRQAFIETAQAAGLPLLKITERNPLKTTSFGAGQLIAKALDAGCRDIYLGLGGSATNDGGTGALAALGVRFADRSGKPIARPSGKDLTRIAAADVARLHPGIAGSSFTVLSDVTNPLYGKTGAAYVYAPQKGADARMVRALDAGLRNFAQVAARAAGRDVRRVPGAGAAGGMGAGFVAFLNARVLSGVETILKLGGFEQKLRKADLVLTGEGKIDRQTTYGKTLGVLFQKAEKQNVPIIALAGSVDPEVYRLVKSPLVSMVSIVPGVVTREDAIARAGDFLEWKTLQMLKAVRAGSTRRG